MLVIFCTVRPSESYKTVIHKRDFPEHCEIRVPNLLSDMSRSVKMALQSLSFLESPATTLSFGSRRLCSAWRNNSCSALLGNGWSPVSEAPGVLGLRPSSVSLIIIHGALSSTIAARRDDHRSCLLSDRGTMPFCDFPDISLEI